VIVKSVSVRIDAPSSGSRTACLTMVFKLCQMGERHWRKLNGSPLLTEVIAGIRFVDGIKEAA